MLHPSDSINCLNQVYRSMAVKVEARDSEDEDSEDEVDYDGIEAMAKSKSSRLMKVSRNVKAILSTLACCKCLNGLALFFVLVAPGAMHTKFVIFVCEHVVCHLAPFVCFGMGFGSFPLWLVTCSILQFCFVIFVNFFGGGGAVAAGVIRQHAILDMIASTPKCRWLWSCLTLRLMKKAAQR